MELSRWSFLDFIFILIVLVSTGLALTKGLMREIISLVALLGGLLLAAFFYPSTGDWFAEFTRTRAIADLLGFLFIFVGVLLLGAITAFLVNRFVKMASLQWMDRLLGACFGFVRGWAIASILALALIAFPVREGLVARSYLAPFLLAGARAAVLIVPQSLKDKFEEQYRKVLHSWNQNRSAL
jgi:membrane protein required for colicin V production